FVLDWVNEKYISRLLELMGERGNGQMPALSLLIGSKRPVAPRPAPAPLTPTPLAAQTPVFEQTAADSELASAESAAVAAKAVTEVQSAPLVRTERTVQVEGGLKHTSYLNRNFTFEN